MRIAGFAALLLFACITAASATPIEATAVAPATVKLRLWCWRFPDPACKHAAADAARAQCAGAKPRFVRSALLQRTFRHGQEALYIYDCAR